MKVIFYILVFLSLISEDVWAQEKKKTPSSDSIRVIKKTPKPQLEKLAKPSKAAVYSAVFPGAGQIYNKKYWKLPIVYGLGAYLVYNYTVYNERFLEARNNLTYITDQNPTNDLLIDDRFEGYTEDNFRRRRDQYRRRKDYHVIFLILWYAACAADAAVDAHLSEFNVDDEGLALSFNSQSVDLYPNASIPSFGVRYRF